MWTPINYEIVRDAIEVSDITLPNLYRTVSIIPLAVLYAIFAPKKSEGYLDYSSSEIDEPTRRIRLRDGLGNKL